MYIGEGSKRNRNRAAIGNSDPRVVMLATRWLRALSRNKLQFSVQYHADQDLRELSEFWASTLGMTRKTSDTRCSAHACRRGWIACKNSG
jgi:hypothetical protein